MARETHLSDCSAMTNAPTILNLFHNIDFVFKCDYSFNDRYDGEEDFFNGSVKNPAAGFSDNAILSATWAASSLWKERTGVRAAG